MTTFTQIYGTKDQYRSDVLEHTIQLAVEIVREGREGRKIGTIFVVSDEKKVLRRSRPLILDPLHGHALKKKRICDPHMRETIKDSNTKINMIDGIIFTVSKNDTSSEA